MNRREFTRNLAAFSLAPLMPVSSLAKAAAPAASAGNSMMFINAWSTQYVRKVGACSPDQLAKHFGLVPETARHVTQHLIEKGVLAAPNALGISHAVKPIPGMVENGTHNLGRRIFDDAVLQSDGTEFSVGDTADGETQRDTAPVSADPPSWPQMIPEKPEEDF